MKKTMETIMNDYPDIADIARQLTTEYMGRTVFYEETVTSTNDIAKQTALNGECNGALFICKNQVNGRGRRGRHWISQDGGLCMSIVIYPKAAVEFFPRYSVGAAVAVCLALRSFGAKAQIKWPNDIYIMGKKVCGMLCESSFVGDGNNFIVCGIGVNVCGAVDSQIDSIATSLQMQGISAKREDVCAAVLNEAEKTFALCDSASGYEQLLKEYELMSAVIGKNVVIATQSAQVRGIAEGLDMLGRICIKMQNGDRLLFDSGDVSLRVD